MDAKQKKAQIDEALKKFKDQYKVEKVEDNKYEFTVTIKANAFQQSYDAILKQQSGELKAKGFRDGKVPPQSVEKQLKQEVLNKTFQTLAQSYILSALYSEELNPIMPARIEETPKIILGTDIKFTFTITTEPEFDLPDFSKIDLEDSDEEVKANEEELTNALENLHKNVVQIQKKEDTENKKGEEKKDDESKKDISEEDKESKEEIRFKEETPKEFTDEWAVKVAKKLKIPGIEKLDDLKNMIETEIIAQKKKTQEMNFQKKVMEKIKEKVDVKIPQEAIDFEVEQRKHSFEHRLKETNTNLKKWLEKQDMTEKELNKIWEEDAEDALKESTILNKYADKKELTVSQEEIKNIEESYKKQYKDFQPTNQWRNQITAVLIKQKAFNKILEEIKK